MSGTEKGPKGRVGMLVGMAFGMAAGWVLAQRGPLAPEKPLDLPTDKFVGGLLPGQSFSGIPAGAGRDCTTVHDKAGAPTAAGCRHPDGSESLVGVGRFDGVDRVVLTSYSWRAADAAECAGRLVRDYGLDLDKHAAAKARIAGTEGESLYSASFEDGTCRISAAATELVKKAKAEEFRF